MLEKEERQALADLKAILESLDLSLLIIGASARILIFDYPLNISGRATTDWDVAIEMETWNDYQQLSDRLVSPDQPCFRGTSIPHKFVHILTEVEFDLVPFGALAPSKTLDCTPT
ncbi:MAG: hypothetical protein WA902_24975 [Thermosynechococcaceae cyanobacterium]